MNDDLKKRYEKVHKAIGEAKKNLDKKLRSLAGFGDKSREDLDPIIEEIFGKQYYEALLDLEGEIRDAKDASFGDADYKIIFNQKVRQLLTDEAVGSTVKDFAQKYDELTETSPFLSISSNSFFSANCLIVLSPLSPLIGFEFSRTSFMPL